ncbi:MAG: DegT/DnrJ/EryC1/StrS family aminotransferase [Alphaproteobacteria bacterium]|nr:DegT/DnrJ/EryC1/StrS family aminotransferase [Alphaproteobacteria bacterium]
MTQPRPMLQKYLISDLPKADELLPLLRRLDETRWYSNFGQLSQEFEQKMLGLLTAADRHPQHGPLYIKTMSTGYHALEVGLRMLKVPQGGKVLMPAVTFPACPLSALHMGGDALLADVDPDSWALTPETARRVAEKTKLSAVMPVAIYGVPLDADAWDKFQRDTNIPVIIDAAAAIETQPIPAHGLVAHSLHATKPFGVGEGGLLVSRDEKMIAGAHVYSNFGTYDRIATVDGSNTKMSEYHAAVGVLQTQRWEKIKSRRKQIFATYQKHLAPLSNNFSLQPGIEQAVVSSFMLRLNRPCAAAIIAAGPAEGIAFHKAYLPPLYRHPHFANLSVANREGKILPGDTTPEKKAAHMPESEMMFAHIVGVPFHTFMDEEDIKTVATTLRRLIAA